MWRGQNKYTLYGKENKKWLVSGKGKEKTQKKEGINTIYVVNFKMKNWNWNWNYKYCIIIISVHLTQKHWKEKKLKKLIGTKQVKFSTYNFSILGVSMGIWGVSYMIPHLTRNHYKHNGLQKNYRIKSAALICYMTRMYWDVTYL